MTKKIIIAITILLSALFISTYAFAENDMQKMGEGVKDAGEGVRNVVGGAENMVENAAAGTSNAVKSGMNAAGDATKDAAQGVKNVANTVTNDGYNATKTAATGTFAGMSTNVWTWFILAIVALAIIGLVWYYSTQNSHSDHSHHE